MIKKLFGKANPPEGKKYDFTYARLWSNGRGFGISWGAREVGFGEVYFEAGPEGQVHIDTEMMSDDFVKELLFFMVDKATKDDQPKTWKTMNDYWQEGRAAADGAENPYGFGNDQASIWWQQGYDSAKRGI